MTPTGRNKFEVDEGTAGEGERQSNELGIFRVEGHGIRVGGVARFETKENQPGDVVACLLELGVEDARAYEEGGKGDEEREEEEAKMRHDERALVSSCHLLCLVVLVVVVVLIQAQRWSWHTSYPIDERAGPGLHATQKMSPHSPPHPHSSASY